MIRIGALGFRHELRGINHLLHAPASADDAVVVEFGVALADEISMLGAEPLVLERTIDHDQQFIDFERLLQVIERSEFHRLDGALDRRVCGHHQNLRPIADRRR